MVGFLIVGGLVLFLVSATLWLAAHPDKHPAWLRSKDAWVRGWVSPRRFATFDEQEIESRRKFAEQWSKHPTLSKRKAAAIKKSLKRRKGKN